MPRPPEFFRWFHMPAAAQRRFYGREVYDAAFQFAAVRNPYAWMISFLFMVNLCDAIGSTVPADVLPLWFCPTLVSDWPVTTNSQVYHRTAKGIITSVLTRLERDARTSRRFMADFFLAEMLPLHAAPTQLAWVSNDAGDTIIVHPALPSLFACPRLQTSFIHHVQSPHHVVESDRCHKKTRLDARPASFSHRRCCGVRMRCGSAPRRSARSQLWRRSCSAEWRGSSGCRARARVHTLARDTLFSARADHHRGADSGAFARRMINKTCTRLGDRFRNASSQVQVQ